MKMTRLSRVLFGIFLAGTFQSCQSACDVNKCRSPSLSGSIEDDCRELQGYRDCVRSESTDCGNEEVRNNLNKAVKEAQQNWDSLDCGNDQTRRNPCDLNGCIPLTKDGTRERDCRIVGVYVDCLQHSVKNCGNDQIRDILKRALKQGKKQIRDMFCGDPRYKIVGATYGRSRYRGDDDAATGLVSSLFICLGMAGMAYFLTKFR